MSVTKEKMLEITKEFGKNENDLDQQRLKLQFLLRE